MKILIIGGGGREHAISYGLSLDNKIDDIFITPGNDGIKEAKRLEINSMDFDAVFKFVNENKVELVVPGPENPLVEGITDFLNERGIKVFGPNKSAARLEGSKSFAKDFMAKYNIPTAQFKVYDDSNNVISDIENGIFSFPMVIKCDGLAAGKGVFIVNSKEEAFSSVEKIMDEKIFKDAGNKIVVEEFLDGKELSYMVVSDGENFFPLIPSRDHKKVFDGGKGPNTGGMGAIAWENLIHEDLRREIENKIITPVIENFSRDYSGYKGVLYAGLMLTKDGPKVLEFNCRFGDPETQPIVYKMDFSLLELFERSIDGTLDKMKSKWKDGCSMCVVLSSKGYPGKYEKGKVIDIGNLDDGVKLFFAGVKKEGDKFTTNGGRVLCVTALGKDNEDVREKVYKNVEKIYFEGMHFRWDIGEIL